MKYFRVKKQYDNFSCVGRAILVKNELYTEKEMKRFRVPSICVEECEVNPKETHFFFGARFSNDCPYCS